MIFFSFEFFIFIFISLCIFHLFRKTRWCPYIIAIINFVFISSFAHSLYQLIPLFSFLLLGYLSIAIIYKYPSTKAFGTLIVLILGLFIYFKRYTIINFLPALPQKFEIIGLSYILFRIIQLLIDIKDGIINQPITPIDYFNFICFFLNFVSGPIQSFQSFHIQNKALTQATLTDDIVYHAFARIILGFIKVIILTQLVPIYIFDAHEFLLARPSTFNIIHAQLIGLMCWYAVATLSYLFLLYMNFSGYMDIIIGIGKLFYFDLPENFNRPFAANNFLEFWSRWHITLSTWFKNYIFYPFLKYMLKQWNKPKFSLYFGIIAYFITFFIIGLWHATTIQFIICGTLFGLGTSINKAYQAIMVKIYGKNKYHQYQKNLLYHYLSRGLTIAYFALALTCFWLKTNQFNAFFNGRFFLTIFIDIILLTFLLASAFFIWDLLMEKTTDIKLVLIRSSCLQYIALGIGIFLLTGAMVNAIYTAPTFIYKTF